MLYVPAHGKSIDEVNIGSYIRAVFSQINFGKYKNKNHDSF